MGVPQRAVAVAAAFGLVACLDSPPAAVNQPDASLNEGTDGGAACSLIVHNQFDNNEEWEPFQDANAAVLPQSDMVQIVATPPGAGAGGVITAVATSELGETEFRASFTIAEGSTGSCGISWTTPDDADYYDFVVDNGELVAVDAPDGESSEVRLCQPSCPDYDPIQHARIRLRAVAGMVHYQFASAEGAWEDLAIASVRSGVHSALAYGWSDADEVTDMTVTDMAWWKCF